MEADVLKEGVKEGVVLKEDVVEVVAADGDNVETVGLLSSCGVIKSCM